jgi:hypothetical protein
MKWGIRAICLIAGILSFAILGWSQPSPTPDPPSSKHRSVSHMAKRGGPGKQMGSGGKDIGKGVAKGTGQLAKGTAGSVGHLAQGNLSGAGASLGKGAGGMGKSVGVGTVKGTYKLGKGIGGELKKL